MTVQSSKQPIAAPKTTEQEKAAEVKHHEKAVRDTFPGSDPLSTTQPGGGITGPKDNRERNPRR